MDERAEAKRRFGKLPIRIDPADLVESQPSTPPPEPEQDENLQAVRWFGIPL